ncbi:unnamed protein product [Phytophthora lilii]|uniref:Unnamed protein product n=1 Tax=Phytophthora lilii TaxID=2077276 RepID=A0A9W6X2W2_9STRA|nr:unnamed protein product [Phytophthora lilii]
MTSRTSTGENFVFHPPAPKYASLAAPLLSKELVLKSWLVNAQPLTPVTLKNDNDAPAAGGEKQAELESQLALLRTDVDALQSTDQPQQSSLTESTPRVPSVLPRFYSKRDEDVY